ncbi:Protoporphyrinogen oxidase [Pedobacter westerhofensis]|uniref:Protoporphyrinogen oxidase n=1 Tax=Pedobacter westerhofensis TaxID=425512 RepID=A0A521C8G4_9SPHI|nr:NAD(P)-binding protein [Pedobacter westerhofensis]SMO55772.1 Protoporphyrinogen oxidase [Pedobacter westerhofensis]
MILILGAGLAGISCSYHLGHECLVVEKNGYPGGHIYSHHINGFTWDEGPHVSFTKHQYVKDLFEEAVGGDFLEYPVYPTNYYKGSWVPHPAQSNLHAVPEPVRSKCLSDFLESRTEVENINPSNYYEWLQAAFGNEFSNEFVTAYTEKYWTVHPRHLTTDWVGGRVFFPDIETVKKGFEGPLDQSTHYITSVRYPNKGGYFSYTDKMVKGMNVEYDKCVQRIDLNEKVVYFEDGSMQQYTKLINTLPLPEFIKFIDAGESIKGAAENLSCSELLLLNFVVGHPATNSAHWLYVYDLDKYSTRINFTELLSPNNGVAGKCGIQVEVYFSKYKKQEQSLAEITQKVTEELIEMGLIRSEQYIEETHTNFIKYANVIFDHKREESLNKILSYLSSFGLLREKDDLEPMTDWNTKLEISPVENLGDLVLAGRFGQWKYYWTDDCILRGKYIKESIKDEH